MSIRSARTTLEFLGKICYHETTIRQNERAGVKRQACGSSRT
ncbi:hypothetical protein [Caballeronia sp. J97]|nr:hypothetical protein [Caballeronia sp. J97]